MRERARVEVVKVVAEGRVGAVRGVATALEVEAAGRLLRAAVERVVAVVRSTVARSRARVVRKRWRWRVVR